MEVQEDGVVEEVRRISQNLSTGSVSRFGLVSALRDLANTLDQASDILAVNFICHQMESVKLEENIEIQLYQSLQELLTNCIRHAEATSLSLQLIRDQDELTLMVEDNGVGFDINEVLTYSGQGLTNVKHRIEGIGGEVSFDSGKGGGTTVSIILPIDRHYD